MTPFHQLADLAILEQLGQRLAAQRLDRGLSQARLAAEAGVGKRTLERIENGQSAQLVTLVRVLRVLDLLDHLDAAIPPPAPRPLDLLERDGAPRQRAPRKTRTHRGETAGPWTWDEDA